MKITRAIKESLEKFRYYAFSAIIVIIMMVGITRAENLYQAVIAMLLATVALSLLLLVEGQGISLRTQMLIVDVLMAPMKARAGKRAEDIKNAVHLKVKNDPDN